MQQLIRTDQYNPRAEIATVISQKYYFKNGDFPDGYGYWIFTNAEAEPLEIEGYYSSAVHLAQKHFRKLGYRFCYVSTDSHKLPSPKGRLKSKTQCKNQTTN